LIEDKVKKGNRETRIEALIGLSFFAFLWICVVGGFFLYLPLAQCQLDLSSDVGATCQRALKRGFMPAFLRSDVQTKIIARYRDAQNHDKVIEALKDLELHQPLDASQQVLRGQAYAALQKPAEAREAFVTALTLSPDHEDSFTSLMNLSTETGDYAVARADAADFLRNNPKSAQALSWAAWVEQQDKQPEKAIAFYQQAIATAPDNAYHHNGLAEVYRSEGRNSLAIESYTASIKLDPNNTYILSNRAELLTQKGDHKAAQDDYLASLAQYRETYVLVALAESYGKSNEFEKAWPLLDEALTTSENAEWVHSAKIAVLSRAGKFEEAATSIAVLEKQLPASPFIFSGQGIVFEMKGQFAEAYEAYDNAAELLPNDSLAQLDVARMLLKLNQPKDALIYAEKALALTTRLASCYMVRAASHAALGDFASASKDYRTAIQLEPSNPQFQSEAFGFMLEKGFKTQAIFTLGHIRRADPSSPVIAEFENKLAAMPDTNP
jgi:tetratricopeptide (TPR) repeat protein